MRAEVAKRRAEPGSPLSFLFVAVFVDMIGYGIVVPLLPFYARTRLGRRAGRAARLPVRGGTVCRGPFLGGLSDRAGRRSVLILCLLGASLAYLLLGLADSLPLLIAAVALAGLASATLANAQAYIADVTPPSQSRAWKLKTARFAVSSLRHIAFPVVSEWYQEVMDYHSSNTPE